jgi:hypothetical protein
MILDAIRVPGSFGLPWIARRPYLQILYEIKDFLRESHNFNFSKTKLKSAAATLDRVSVHP